MLWRKIKQSEARQCWGWDERCVVLNRVFKKRVDGESKLYGGLGAGRLKSQYKDTGGRCLACLWRNKASVAREE